MVLWYRPRPVGLVDRLRCIVDCLREHFGEHAAKVDRTAGPMVQLIHGRLLRRVARFAALVARFHAGTLPSPCPAPEVDEPERAASERAMPERAAPEPSAPERSARVRAPDPLPSGRGWLVRLIQPTAGYSGFLEQMLRDPEMIALLAASPQAGRLLRPMWRMLSLQPYPEALRPPPPRPRPAGPADSVTRRASARRSASTSSGAAVRTLPFARPVLPRLRRARMGVRRTRSWPPIQA